MLARLTFAVALFAAATAPTAAADGGPLFSSLGGRGIAHGTTRYIPIGDSSGNTELLAVSTNDGTELNQLALLGQWGLPSTAAGADGLSRDGKTLVLAGTQSGLGSPSLFLVVNPARMQIVRTITLHGYFSFDALSPDGSRMYLIQYTYGRDQNLSDYIVRGYDLRVGKLLPGRIADRTQKGWVMHGYPMTRTWSADGRWVYTLYTDPGSYPFVHALDTVRGVAHCITLPWEEDQSQNALSNLVLDVHDGGPTLALHWRSGRPWLDVAVGTWRISYPHPGFPWEWVSAGIGGSLALVLAGALLLWRRQREEVDERPRQELGLA